MKLRRGRDGLIAPTVTSTPNQGKGHQQRDEEPIQYVPLSWTELDENSISLRPSLCGLHHHYTQAPACACEPAFLDSLCCPAVSPSFMQVTDKQVREVISGLLAARQPSATICPSEAARALAPDAWRPLMPQVRAVAIAMATEGLVDIRQSGRTVVPEAPLRGPIRLGQVIPNTAGYPTTPDGRYFVVRGRLWRKANPQLSADLRDALVRQLMEARRALRKGSSEAERQEAREQIDRAKRALGERGPVWWTDGEPDFNRKLVKNTSYRDWFERLSG